jgi:hypothetical protein
LRNPLELIFPFYGKISRVGDITLTLFLISRSNPNTTSLLLSQVWGPHFKQIIFLCLNRLVHRRWKLYKWQFTQSTIAMSMSTSTSTSFRRFYSYVERRGRPHWGRFQHSRQKSDFHGNSDFQNHRKLDPLQKTAKKSG